MLVVEDEAGVVLVAPAAPVLLGPAEEVLFRQLLSAVQHMRE